MTNDEVKQYLEQIRHINKNIQAKLMQLEQLRAQTENTTSVIKPSVVQSHNGSGFSEASDRIVDVQKRLQDDIKEQSELLYDIHNQLDCMFKDYPKLTNLLYMRYVNGLNWPQVCVNLEEYSERHVYTLHDKALEVFKLYIN